MRRFVRFDREFDFVSESLYFNPFEDFGHKTGD